MNEEIKIQELSLGNVSQDLPTTTNAQDQPSVYLVETFYITSKKNTVFQVRLTEKGLSLRKKSNGSSKEQTILLEDIIGCRCLRSKRKRNTTAACACSSLPGGESQLRVVEDNSVDLDETDVSAYLYIYAYILKKNRRGGLRERTTLTLRFRSFDKYDDNNKEAQKWRSAVKKLLTDRMSMSPNGYTMKDMRKVLILVNPKSGSGKARETFQQRVAPIFLEAEIPYELHVTKHANYARDYVRHKDIHIYKYIVVVGGDGLYFEVINGMFERADWERAISEISIGIIPCGSGNGLAKSIAHSYNEPYDAKPILCATLTNVRGKCNPIDLVRVETKSQIMFSFLSVGWGLISDIDIESERLRMIGYPRFTLWSIHRLINLRTYHGTVSYLPASNIKMDQTPQPHNRVYKTNLKHSISCGNTLECFDCKDGECEACDTGFGDVLSLETTSGGATDSFRPRMDSWYSANSRKSTYFSTTDSYYQSVAEKTSSDNDCIDSSVPAQMYGPAATIPSLITPVPDNWTIETGEFLMVHAVSQTHISSDCFFAPSSALNDGVIWLCIIRGGASRKELLKFFLGMSTGTHLPVVPSEYISMIPVLAFRIDPIIDSSEEKHGHLTVDGEKVEYGPIQGEVFPSIARVMVPNFSL